VVSLLILLLVLAVVMSLVFWLGSLFAQSYFYTEPVEGLAWRGPAAGVALAVFFLLWSLLNIAGGNSAIDKRIPYPWLLSFTDVVDLVPEPVPEIESMGKKADEPVSFKLDKQQKGGRYKKVNDTQYWSAVGVAHIKIKHDNQEYTFVYDGTDEGGYAHFVDKEHGWEIKEQRMGIPSQSSPGRLLIYFIINLLHLVVWIACFWLILRYAPGHAVVLGGIFWLGFSVIFLAVLFERVQAVVA
jgi:hypothetical protein